MRPQLLSVYFADARHQYPRLARVLDYSARQHCATWEIRVERLDPSQLTPYASDLGIDSHVTNTQKLERWNAVVQAAPVGTPLLFMDADMLILRPLDDIWARPFDLAYTVREHSFPFNGGVIFVRVSDRVRAFFADLLAVNLRFLGNKAAHHDYRRKYAGINQAAFGYLLETQTHGCDLLTLPCLEWNCCDRQDWKQRDPRTRIVHYKSGLRRALFGLQAATKEQKPWIGLWKAEEQALLRARAEA